MPEELRTPAQAAAEEIYKLLDHAVQAVVMTAIISGTKRIPPCPELVPDTAAIIERHEEENKNTGAGLIAAERRRQIETEGFTAEHDDKHTRRELALAACAYALPKSYCFRGEYITPQSLFDLTWWDQKWFKRSNTFNSHPENMIPDLIKAGALIAAEIDRLKRQQKAAPCNT